MQQVGLYPQLKVVASDTYITAVSAPIIHRESETLSTHYVCYPCSVEIIHFTYPIVSFCAGCNRDKQRLESFDFRVNSLHW